LLDEKKLIKDGLMILLLFLLCFYLASLFAISAGLYYDQTLSEEEQSSLLDELLCWPEEKQALSQEYIKLMLENGCPPAPLRLSSRFQNLEPIHRGLCFIFLLAHAELLP
jgi:hypothetical protein